MENKFNQPLKNCITCDSKNINLYHVDFRDINIFKCEDCSQQFMNPQYTDEYLDHCYSTYTTEEDHDYWYEPTSYGNNFYLDIVEKYLTPGNMLDVGCGNGHLLRVAKERGWKCVRHDVDKESVEKVKKRVGIPTLHGNFLDIKIEEKFDLITLHQVLEHRIRSTKPMYEGSLS